MLLVFLLCHLKNEKQKSLKSNNGAAEMIQVIKRTFINNATGVVVCLLPCHSDYFHMA